MASTQFIEHQTVIQADWANDINDFYYTLFNGATSAESARVAIDAVSKSGDTTEGNYTNNGLITTTSLTTTSDCAVGGDFDVAGNTQLNVLNVNGATAFSEIPTAPTAASNDNSTKLATTKFVQTVAGSPVSSGVAKAWAVFSPDSSGGITTWRSYNVSSITSGGVGHFTVNYTITLALGSLPVVGSLMYNLSEPGPILYVYDTSPQYCQVWCTNGAGNLRNPASIEVVVYGDLA